MKKIAIFFCMLILAFFCSSIANAQFLPEVDEKDMPNQPPLTAKDVEMFSNYMNALFAYLKAEGEGTEEQVEKASNTLSDIVEAPGFDIKRLSYAVAKISVHYSMKYEDLEEAELPPVFKLKPEEKKLLDKHSSSLKKIMEELKEY
jgi:hypothetical protein